MRRFVVVLCASAAVTGAAAPAATLQPDEQTTTQVRIEYGELPSVAAKAAGSMWVLDRRGSTIGQIDPGTNDVVAQMDLKPIFGERVLAWDLDGGRGSLWATIPARRLIVRIDPEHREIRDTIRVRERISDLYVAHGSLWFVRATRRAIVLVRLNARTGKRIAAFRLGRGNTGVTDLVSFGPSVWVVRDRARHVRGRGRNPTFYVKASLWRIDPGSNRVKEKHPLGATYTRGAVNPVVGDVAVAPEGLWMTRVHERRILLMKPATARVLDVQPLPELDLPWYLEVLRGDVWVGDINEATIARVDPETNATDFVDTGIVTSDLGTGFGSLWAPGTDADGGAVVRLTPE
ncbi:MAG TPA: hypothetical protein VHI71_00700 [Actinomycetota bacterium]|nr:hypothetical protein [Actinomycetota bacterium]